MISLLSNKPSAIVNSAKESHRLSDRKIFCGWTSHFSSTVQSYRHVFMQNISLPITHLIRYTDAIAITMKFTDYMTYHNFSINYNAGNVLKFHLPYIEFKWMAQRVCWQFIVTVGKLITTIQSTCNIWFYHIQHRYSSDRNVWNLHESIGRGSVKNRKQITASRKWSGTSRKYNVMLCCLQTNKPAAVITLPSPLAEVILLAPFLRKQSSAFT